jgi:hypothetical protein
MNRFVGVASLLILLGTSFAPAQTRVNDKDIETMMSNLKSDTGRFRSAFDNSVKSSTIRHTSQAKDSRNLVQRFENQTKDMLDHFKSHQKADAELSSVISTSNQIDQLVHDTSFDDRTNSAWSKVRVELGQLAEAYGVPAPSPSQPR